MAQVTGAYWAYLGWASTFRWGTRHLLSAVVWLFFAAVLHHKYVNGWDSRRRWQMILLGGALTFLVVLGSSLNELAFPRMGG